MKHLNIDTSNAPCKKVSKLPVKNPNIIIPQRADIYKGTRSYSPKVRQQIISNKLLNSQLYELYIVRKVHCGGQWLKDNIKDGTITIAKQTYIISWLDILPIDAYKEDAVIISLRTPKFKDKNSNKYSLSYAVVSKFIE